MPTTETLSTRRRTEVLALMCAALAVVTAAFISLNVALPSFARDKAAFVNGLHIAFYSGAAAVLLGTLLFLRLAPRPATAPAVGAPGASVG